MAKKTLNEVQKTEKEFKEKIITFVLGGFGLVAALAWNDAIQSFFNILFPNDKGLIGKFVYAIIITLIVVIVSVNLGKLSEKEK